MNNKAAKKAKKGLLSVVFSRTALVVVLILLQLALKMGLATFLKEYAFYVYAITMIVQAIVVIYIINEKGNPEFSRTWILLILIFPVFGCLFYIYVKLELGTKYIGDRLDKLETETRAYLEQKEELDKLAETVVYTGPIDAYFGYSLGALEYRSVRFETEVLDIPNFQGNAAVNYTDRETPWTRIIEHKWFEFGKDEQGQDLPKTVISREYSSEWKPGDEPYYPVNDEKNGALYAEYKRLADTEKNVIFGGRLAEYRYYDMDAVIASALRKSEEVL